MTTKKVTIPHPTLLVDADTAYTEKVQSGFTTEPSFSKPYWSQRIRRGGINMWNIYEGQRRDGNAHTGGVSREPRRATSRVRPSIFMFTCKSNTKLRRCDRTHSQFVTTSVSVGGRTSQIRFLLRQGSRRYGFRWSDFDPTRSQNQEIYSVVYIVVYVNAQAD